MSKDSSSKTEQRPTPLGNPADFPIGSPQSRAAARAMVEASGRLKWTYSVIGETPQVEHFVGWTY
jgi:hypothetical protein